MARAPFAFTLEARVDSKAISHNALSDHLCKQEKAIFFWIYFTVHRSI